MDFQALAGHALPIVLALVAIVLIIQSLFERDDSSREKKASTKKSPVSPTPDPVGLLDLTDGLDDDPDDPYEITVMGEVPIEIMEQMRGILEDKSEGGSEESEKEFFLVTGVARSDRGLRRRVNEDAYLVIEEESLFLVADGMGGYAGGDVAAQLAVEVIENAFRKKNFDGPVNTRWPQMGDELVRTFHQAHDAVREKKRAEPDYKDMGTTAVAMRFSPDKTKAYIASVGDSRCYRFRDGVLTQLTTDHTLGTLLGVQGKAGRKLTQAIGVHDTIAVDLKIDEPRSRDVYLVCSDGLTKMVDDQAIMRIVEEFELESSAQMLVEESNVRGGRDNITVVVIRVEDVPSPRES